MEDADGEQNELKTLQGQVPICSFNVHIDGSICLWLFEYAGYKAKTVKLIREVIWSLTTLSQLDQTQKLVQQLSTQLADLRFPFLNLAPNMLITLFSRQHFYNCACYN